jgi:hypothetical protein
VPATVGFDEVEWCIMGFRTFPLFLLIALQGCALSQAPKLAESSSPEPATQPSNLCQPAHDGPVDFQSQVLPLLVSRCSPCHFPGGSMYSRLPFDQEATLEQLGTKLFTRIKKPEEQAILIRFLAQGEAGAVTEGQPASSGP